MWCRVTKPAISVQHLSKKYTIGGNGQRYLTMRDAIADSLKNPFQKILHPHSPPEICALNDVSFDVGSGEVVGIIGRNGAGKSTLLKILSRITPPTAGCVELRGRVGSLLEVGTGFHPELTGRENIYLNGSILGMRRQEINNRFEDIVTFAEIKKFLDTPVKHYSSGMYVRLAFSVAAHLEPEILLVDEVLAVGDASFQKKCLNKMEDVRKSGRTVIFVSHNMASITRLCQRTILLDDGKIIMDGPSHHAVSRYLRSGLGTAAVREWTDAATAPGNSVSRLRGVRVHNDTGTITDSIDIRRPVQVEMEYDVLEPGHVLTPNLHFFNDEGLLLFVTSNLNPAWRRVPRPVGRFTSSVTIPGNFFAEGTVIVEAALSTMDPLEVHFDEKDVVVFQVIDTLDGDSARGDYAGHFPGVIRPLLQWTDRILESAPP
jgi:lipopolysaccharide transport system ATP-binding protein